LSVGPLIRIPAVEFAKNLKNIKGKTINHSGIPISLSGLQMQIKPLAPGPVLGVARREKGLAFTRK
jgi:hypothetical protein